MFPISENALATNFGDESEGNSSPKAANGIVGAGSKLVNEFQRRLIVYTFGAIIEIPYTYISISGLRKDFSNIVSYSRINMDFVVKKLKLQRIYSI